MNSLKIKKMHQRFEPIKRKGPIKYGIILGVIK